MIGEEENIPLQMDLEWHGTLRSPHYRHVAKLVSDRAEVSQSSETRLEQRPASKTVEDVVWVGSHIKVVDVLASGRSERTGSL